MQLSLQRRHEDVSSDGRQTSDKQLRLNLYSGVGVCDGALPPPAWCPAMHPAQILIAGEAAQAQGWGGSCSTSE